MRLLCSAVSAILVAASILCVAPVSYGQISQPAPTPSPTPSPTASTAPASPDSSPANSSLPPASGQQGEFSLYLPIGRAPVSAPAKPITVVISALHFNGLSASLDEAIQLTNLSLQIVTLDSRWSIHEGGSSFPLPTLKMAPGARIWLAHDSAAFRQSFGFTPTAVFGSALGFSNSGGEARLVTETSKLVDSVNSNGGAWPAGSGGSSSGSPCCYRSMERIDPARFAWDSNWASAMVTRPVAWDSGSNPITGTPRAPNSVAVSPAATGANGVVINEVAWGGTKSSSTHEWMELYNQSPLTVSLAGWYIRAIGSTTRTIPLAGQIRPRGFFLIQRTAATFSAGAIADLTVSWSALSNSGERLELVSADQRIVDAVVYGDGVSQGGWSGPALQPYTVPHVVPASGQLVMRKLDLRTGRPVADTDTARDWLNDSSDPVSGRHPMYPGWDYERFVAPAVSSSPITVAITPDAGFEVLSRTLASATRSIDMEVYTFDHARLADLLALKVSRGVTVRVLLEGSPVGTFPAQELWMCQRINTPASGCWFMESDAATGYARYDYLHSKFAVIDGRQLVVSSENFGSNGFPDDPKANGTAGERGVLAVVSAPALIARAQAIFDADLDSAHADVTRWCASGCPFGPPPPGFTPLYTTDGISYTTRFIAPLVVNGLATVELATSPESNLRTGGIVGVLYAAGAGDEVLVEQMDEPYYWGATGSNPASDPNPRLQAIIGAAQRGAKVRLVLDRYYDVPSDVRSNDATTRYLLDLAQTRRWDIQAVRGDPTFHGIHNKMVLVRAGNRKYAQIGSWNGTETSAKLNREMTLLIESAQVYDYLRAVFYHDFFMSRPVFVPLVMRRYTPLAPIAYPLISEVLFNPAGADEAGREWIEIYNPSGAPISLNGYKIGDAETPGRSYQESMYQFPPTAALPARGVVVVAGRADLYFSEWGSKPTYELVDYDPTVPELPAYTAWSTGTLSLGNSNDQVLLLGPDNAVVDALVWVSPTLTTGVTVAGVIPFTGTLTADHTLQRWPVDQDSNNCSVDFRDQVLPSPGRAP